jgi:Holliday junction DNA helicase RuvA
MIAYIDGKLAYKDPTFVIIDVQGVGYQIKISLNTYAALKNTEEKCRLHTFLHIKEDSHTLFGFFELNEKSLFAHLISVSGIGPGTALMMLSSLTVDEIQQAIVQENVRLIQGIKGIGAKTAQRVILELKDKIKREGLTAGLSDTPAYAHNNAREEALSALITLGFAKPAAEKSLDAVIKSNGATPLKVEDLIKKVLKSA